MKTTYSANSLRVNVAHWLFEIKLILNTKERSDYDKRQTTY